MDITMDAVNWAEEQFSQCDLGDARRTKRLVNMAKRLCASSGDSYSSCCGGDEAALEAGYRLIRNQAIKPSAIAEGLYKVTYQKTQERKLLLAIEDTTTLSYSHEVDALGDTGGPSNAVSRGFHAHSVLLVDAQTEGTIGLISQTRWNRPVETRGKSHHRAERAYEEKESYKWELSSRQLEKRMQADIGKVISVCDREADLYEYLMYKVSHGHRFIVRGGRDKVLEELDETKVSEVLSESEELGRYKIKILQKSGRKARVATIGLKTCQVKVKSPRRLEQGEEILTLKVVWAYEIKKRGEEQEAPLCWVLFTTEPAETFEEARQLVRYYELRWKIEEFHKAWKSGAGVERQRMQCYENLERMAVILSAHAVRLLQIKEALEREQLPGAKKISCRTFLTKDEFIVLWFAVQNKKSKRRPPPKTIPSLSWAYTSIAKLGGWSDSKRIGRASWKTLWKGWLRLQDRLEGYELSKISTNL